MSGDELFPKPIPGGDAVTSGNLFFMLQTARVSRDSGAEIVRTLERYGARGTELHALAIAGTNAMEILRHRIATEYEIRSRLEPKRKR